MGIKLLFADDSETMQKVVKLTLQNEGIDLSVVSDGQEAIKAVQGDKPDIVVADISMPGINGFELCEHLKGSPDTKDISVILISGELENYDDNKGSLVGADGHLTKPFKSKEFVTAIKSFVDDKNSEDVLPTEQLTESNAAPSFDPKKILTLTASQSVSPMAGQVMQTDEELEIIEDDIAGDNDLYEELDHDEILITPHEVDDDTKVEIEDDIEQEADISVLDNSNLEESLLDDDEINDELIGTDSFASEDRLVDEISVEAGFASSAAELPTDYSLEDGIGDSLPKDDDIDSIFSDPLGSNPLGSSALGGEAVESDSELPNDSLDGDIDTLLDESRRGDEAAAEPDEGDYDVESLWDSFKGDSDTKAASEAGDEVAALDRATELDISDSLPVSEVDRELEPLRESVEESVKEFIEQQGKEVLQEIIAKSVEDNVRYVIERELEKSIREEVATLIGDSFKAAMPELIESVKGMIVELTPGVAAEIAKKATGQIKKED